MVPARVPTSRLALLLAALAAAVAVAAASGCDSTTGATAVCPDPDADLPDNPCRTPLDDAGVQPIDVLFPDAAGDGAEAVDDSGTVGD